MIDVSRIKVACAGCSLSELCLPYGVGRSDLEQLGHIVQQQQPLKTGQYLYRIDDPFTAVYAVRSGAIKTYIISDDGHEQITGFHLPGELLGFDAIARDAHACFAVALNTTSVCSIPFARLSELASQVPGIQRQLFRLMSREIADNERMLLLLGQMPAEHRLAAFVLHLSQRFHQLGYSAREFDLPMPRSDIANYLGLAVETVSRLFSRLQSEGVLTVRNRTLRLLDMERLRSAAGAFIQPLGRSH